MINQNDIDLFLTEKDEVLYKMIHSKIATERSAAVRILAVRYQNDLKFIEILLERLTIEKSLYTKLEISSVLEQANIEAVRMMVNYIGKIGHNQHKELPASVSKKVSYPLPRDIIARTLSKMSPTIFDVLLQVLQNNNIVMIAEVLDAIGFMTFYHNQLVTSSNAQFIYDTMEKYQDNQIILWKSVLCLSAFPLENSIHLLNKIKYQYPGTLISLEADRSLKLIHRIPHTHNQCF